MYEEAYGLRFDIYERVHLSDECVGIVELEEVELTPHIQVIPAGDQVTVRGSLLLAGVYEGDDEGRGSQSLEHWIPVEITLPLNRIRSLEDISVDIEHFDVDLLSSRSLNITGILSLKGIAMEPAEPSSWEPEQFTVVHQTEEERGSDEPEWLRDYGEEASRPPSLEALDAVARIRSLADGTEQREEEWQAVPEPAAEPVREKTYSEYIDQIGESKKAAANAEAEEAGPEQDPGRPGLTWDHAPWAFPSVTDLPPAAPKAVAEAEAFGADNGQQGEPEHRGLDEEFAAESEAEEMPSEASADRTGEETAKWNMPQPQSWAAPAPAPEPEPEPASAPEAEEVAPTGRTGKEPAKWNLPEPQTAAASAHVPEAKPASVPEPAVEAQAEPRAEEKPSEASASVASAAPAASEPAAEASIAEASVGEAGGAEEQTATEANPREEAEAEPAEDAAAAAASAADAKPEMKIAINSSKPAEAPAASGVGFSSLLQSSRQTKEREQREAETKQAEEEAALEAAKMTTGDDVKWQSLFLQRVNEEQGFKKVRMCIVQREETLDTIADRYQMNSNEIVLYNRLSDQNVTEGQVLYIPVTS
ncbi:LysM peptidoglycan-binding domain-containing protein [Paenibacillus dendritiformis]|uniref:LysM peptidoglycan-binding domain-containing protein n=1 Tax=Paenibacillus dendritiformis TaxID=130049 RepID=UPI000DA898AC|nr:LysM peptidoglycan-binding domain-containing protein [Paenibacillus dendritiformis]PZM66652.1 peptidoglycan-binding protein [Paenibacillus dendritiformis]